MPIYMDRHELAGTTAEEVAQAHLKDLAIQDRYGVKFLTYWFDEARGTTFCLASPPTMRRPTASIARRTGTSPTPWSRSRSRSSRRSSAA